MLMSLSSDKADIGEINIMPAAAPVAARVPARKLGRVGAQSCGNMTAPWRSEKWNDGTAWMLPRLIVAPSSTPFLRSLIDQCELNLLFHRIDTVHQHTNSLSHAECLACALADDFTCVLVEGVMVVNQRVQRD